MKLIVVSPSDKLDSEISILEHLFENGLPIYHLRKMKYSTRKMKIFIQDIPEKYHDRIVIHSHHELAVKFNLKGIYISRAHKAKKLRLWLKLNWIKLQRNNLQISTTFRNPEYFSEYNPVYNYVFLSPVFDSFSGKFQAGFSEHILRSIMQNTKYTVIARGGISADNIHKAKEIGFAGVAVYTDIWKSNNSIEKFLKIKEKFAELEIPVE